MSLLNEINESYIKVHYNKEKDFWSSNMRLNTYENGSFETTEKVFREWISNPRYISKIRETLNREELPELEKQGLEGWLKFFEVNIIEDPEAQALQRKLIEAEGSLENKRNSLVLGYINPDSNSFVKAYYGELTLINRSEKDERIRKAAWEGLKKIGPFILENGFLEVVKLRNQLAHKLGYEDYYDYKVNLCEGISKKKLFEILDELEEKTKDTCFASVQNAIIENGRKVLNGWNFNYLTAGDLTADLDPYFKFSTALSRWIHSFSAMGITYNGANLQLDLLDRDGKFLGFMNNPIPGYIDNGVYKAAQINFSNTANPNKIGNGYEAHLIFFHEGGHAAHYSNIKRSAPCFSQPSAPTSPSFSETQSTFLESLIDDPIWLISYAKDLDGTKIPFSLIQRNIENKHRFLAKYFRNMLAVCYVEKGIYEMSDDALTAENVIAMSEFWESEMECVNSVSRSVLSVPHIIIGGASAYYHSYILAEMAVYQTRNYFLNKFGYIVDNPRVGKELTKTYWECGNEKDFLTLVEELTEEPFNARATEFFINRPIEDLILDAQKAIADNESREREASDMDLDATLKLMDGDVEIASSERNSFEKVAEQFNQYVSMRFPSNE